MEKLMNRIRCALGRSTILNDDRGLTTVEYVIVLMLIAVAAVGLWKDFGGKVTGHIEKANSDIADLTPTKQK